MSAHVSLYSRQTDRSTSVKATRHRWSPKRIPDPKTALRALREKVAERKALLGKLDPHRKLMRLDREIARLRIAAKPG
jgi:hypothetical protein